jgi:hypothetical protein
MVELLVEADGDDPAGLDVDAVQQARHDVARRVVRVAVAAVQRVHQRAREMAPDGCTAMPGGLSTTTIHWSS